MEKETLEGKYDQAKGEVKQDVGELTGDEKLQAEGTWDKVKGSVKEGTGKVKEALDDDKV